jgi:hypothetical protein
LQLTLDYGQMHLPTYGGGFEERLTLYRVTPCAETLTTKETRPADCQEWQALPGNNDLQQQRLTVVLDLTASEPLAARVPFTATHRVFLPFSSGGSQTAVAPEQETLLVLAAAASSGQGDYAATPFNGSSDYQLALAVGAMQTSYAAPLPPAAGGLAPDVTLRYDSGSVDGMTTNKNNQPGWAGIGWNYEPGAITRRLKTCGTPEAPGDLCLTGDNYTIALNGVAAPLVKAANGLYHPQNDPRWKIEKLISSNTSHPDYQREYWLVTMPDGTKYRFGGEFDPDKANADQDSAFYAPIRDLTVCANSTLGGNYYGMCNKAWKWNLDRVEDTNGNVISYYYAQEINYYNARTFIRLPYTRAGNAARIEYGRRAGSATVPTQVLFNTAERCEGACAWPADYPDTPGDLTCVATGTCSQNKPTFWSRKRLDTIYPQYWNIPTSQWITVTQFALSHTFVKPPNDPNGSPNDPKLWLNAITQKSADGATALPAVQYGYVLKPNRRDTTGVSSLTMPRINQITDPLGGVTTFTYGKSHECPIVQSGFAQFPYDCFPAWNPSATPAGFALFNKWKVLSVSASDSFSGNATQTTTYTYSTPINHYDDDPVTPSAQKSYSDFRGSAIVTETDASGAKTEHRFHRGMNGDVGLAGTTTITLSNGETRVDENWLRGREVETRRLRADDSALIRSANWFTTTLTAGSGKTGAYFVDLAKVEQTTTGTFTKNTRTENFYDGYGNLTLQVLHGDLSTTADDRTIQRSYVYSPTGYLMNRPQWEKLWAGTASGTAGQEKAYTAYAYDNLAVGAAPTKGNRTLTRAYSQVTPTATYVDTTTAYDTWGRPTGVTDPNGAPPPRPIMRSMATPRA